MIYIIHPKGHQKDTENMKNLCFSYIKSSLKLIFLDLMPYDIHYTPQRTPKGHRKGAQIKITRFISEIGLFIIKPQNYFSFRLHRLFLRNAQSTQLFLLGLQLPAEQAPFHCVRS